MLRAPNYVTQLRKGKKDKKGKVKKIETENKEEGNSSAHSRELRHTPSFNL